MNEHRLARHKNKHYLLLDQIQNTTRSGDNNMHVVVDAHNVILQIGATSGNHDADAHVLAQLHANARGLQRQLAGGHHHQSLNRVVVDIDLLQQRNSVGAGLAGAVLGSGQDVAAKQSDRYSSLLDGRGLLPALLKDAHQQFAFQAKLLEIIAPGAGHIGSLDAVIFRWKLQLGLPVVPMEQRKSVNMAKLANIDKSIILT